MLNKITIKVLCGVIPLLFVLATPRMARAGEVSTPASTLTCTTGTATITDRYDDTLRAPSIHVKTITATSNASGNLTGCVIPAIYGKLLMWEIVPGATTVQPTNLFDITLVNASTADVLGGQGANVANTGYLQRWTKVVDDGGNVMPVILGGSLTLTGSAMGASKSFTLRLYVQQ